MPSLKRRIVFTSVVSIIAAVFGTLLGYLLASALMVRATQNRLDQYAGRLVADGEASSAELRTVLNAVGASQNPMCSEAEIGYFRALIFESDYLKDVGRMRNGKIECSAVLGRQANTLVQAERDFTQQDGTEIYRHLEPYKKSDLTPITLALDGSYVVFTPMTRMHLESAPMHYFETVTDAPTQKTGRLLGEWPDAKPLVSTAEGEIRQGDSFYVTRCSIRYFNCVTAYTSLPEVLSANHNKFTGCIVLGGVFGTLIGFAVSLLYRRNKNLEQQLLRAIRRDKLSLAYQPIVDLTSRQIVGAEALVRWKDEEGVAVGPDVFVKIAEERGFVGKITELVIRRAMREFGETLRANPDFHLSINVAASDLGDARFLPMLDQALKRAGVAPRSLSIELTEGSTARRGGAVETIRLLRQRGHSVHLDDFGTGYSSLAYLHELSVDAIKIDRAFTQAIGTGSAIMATLPQILVMAEALNLKVIAEGVETSAQAEYFAASERGILAQGWYFGRPVPARELLARLAEPQRTTVAGEDAGLVEGEGVISAA
jgi:sensor c-di-GMP phosphodiesterase-like protein